MLNKYIAQISKIIFLIQKDNKNITISTTNNLLLFEDISINIITRRNFLVIINFPFILN